jgi:ubiquinone/menaquinone biosynthesis C-methylase UbiE
MFDKIAPVYDIVKAHRNYAAEAKQLHEIILGHDQSASRLLEIACGTGTLLALMDDFTRTGVDISPEMLVVASAKQGLGKVMLVQSDMTSLALGQEFDIVLCLDGAIGYVQPDDLAKTLGALAAHVAPGGLLLLEPWYSPQSWKPGRVHTTQQVDENSGITVVRMAYGHLDGSIEFHNLVGNGDGISHFTESYRFWLHEVGDMFDALRTAGMSSVSLDEDQPAFRRGLIVAKR